MIGCSIGAGSRRDSVEPSADARRVINGVIDLNRPAAWPANLLLGDQHAGNLRQQLQRLQPVVLFDA